MAPPISSLPDCPLTQCLKIPHHLAATVTLTESTTISAASVLPLLCYFSFSVPLTVSGLTQRTGACPSRQAFGRETNTWACNAVTLWWMSTSNRCLKALFNPSVPENWCSAFKASSRWRTERRPLQKCAFMAMCCCDSEMFQRSPKGYNFLIDLHKINNADAPKAKQRAVSSCGVTFHYVECWLMTMHCACPSNPCSLFSK